MCGSSVNEDNVTNQPKICSSLHTTNSILEWLNEKNKNLVVHIRQVALKECEPWYYDSNYGVIRNRKGSFFSICGIQQYEGLSKN